MGVQDRLQSRLQPSSLPHDPYATCDLALEPKHRLVRDPHLWQEAAGVEPRLFDEMSVVQSTEEKYATGRSSKLCGPLSLSD